MPDRDDDRDAPFAEHGYSPEELAALALLADCPYAWAEFDPNRFMDIESKVLNLLVVRGLIARRTGARYRMVNQSTTIDFTIQQCGQDPQNDPLSGVSAAAQIEWRGAIAEWRAGDNASVNPFWCEKTGPFEWRLSEFGAIAVSDCRLGMEARVVDFIFRQGQFSGHKGAPANWEVIRLEVVRQEAATAPAVMAGLGDAAMQQLADMVAANLRGVRTALSVHSIGGLARQATDRA